MSVPPQEAQQAKSIQEKESVVIRFAGDSGDGMQLTGMQFTTESALAGNDIGTLPDFPAEIRAPAGTLAGVSAFQVNFASREVFTPGDDVDVLARVDGHPVLCRQGRVLVAAFHPELTDDRTVHRLFLEEV